MSSGLHGEVTHDFVHLWVQSEHLLELRASDIRKLAESDRPRRDIRIGLRRTTLLQDSTTPARRRPLNTSTAGGEAACLPAPPSPPHTHGLPFP